MNRSGTPNDRLDLIDNQDARWYDVAPAPDQSFDSLGPEIKPFSDPFYPLQLISQYQSPDYGRESGQ
jgi:hypothetical protein